MPSLPAPGVGFSTQYAFASSASSSASRKSKTSYSFSTKVSTDNKASFGIPSLAQVSVDAKYSAQQTHDSTVSRNYNTYSGKSESLSSTTGFADHLFFTSSRANIYYYPLLGQSVCPADQPTCADDDKLPLHVEFSGPDRVDHTDIDATTQEWYQPIHEPGNIFSYPWTVDQLQHSLPGLIALTGDPSQPNWRGTDSSSSAYSTEWNQGIGSAQSSGSVNTNQTDASVTVAAQVSIEGFGVSSSTGFDLNSSQSVSTLNTSTQTLDASTGIQVHKPEFSDLVADTYLYSFAGFVLGQTSPEGTLQSIPLKDAQGSPIDLQSSGPLTVAFLADPFQSPDLPWWRQAYTKPDVGLNHPERWDWTKATHTATFNPPDQSSSTPQDQAFYHIKGLFITPQGANGTGPPLTQATAGETLQLQARVSNFSLADMAAGTQVHVRFYGQVYENAELVGPSFLIGQEVTLPEPLCGFNSSSPACTGQPNWALASTPFDIMHLSHLRPNATVQSRVFFRPQTCGVHTLVAVAGPNTPAPATGWTTVEVTLDPVAATEALIATTQGLALPQSLADSLLAKLKAAEKAFAKGNTQAGTNQLNAYINEVQAQRGKQLTAPQADALIGQAKVILDCL